MKVLVFTSAYPNNIWPNKDVFVKERISEFARLPGSEVRIVAPIPYYPPVKFGRRRSFTRVARHEVIEGNRVHHPRYFMTPKVGMPLYGLMMFTSLVPAMRAIRREFDFDLISAHTVYPDGFAGVLFGGLFRRPVVVSARGTDINLFPKFPLIRPLIKYALRRAAHVISVCEALKTEMVALGTPSERITVIPNGVDADKFRPVPKREARARLGIPADKAVILSVGSLIPRKGFDLLIQAVKVLVERQAASPHLVIVGEGSFGEELREQIAALELGAHVRLAGGVPHQELFQWYSAADLFCLASSREGYPNVLLESLACGTPVVATAVWGAPEIIDSDALGILTERSVDGIAEALRSGLTRVWDSDRIVQHARRHTWTRAAHTMDEVFRSSLNREPPLVD